MSTITKLDPLVRVRRANRRAILLQMRRDQAHHAAIVRLGQQLPQSAERDAHLRQLAVMGSVLDVADRHLSVVFSDPSRTGEVKDAIYKKLTAEVSTAAQKADGVFA